jgi:hypothetical protein
MLQQHIDTVLLVFILIGVVHLIRARPKDKEKNGTGRKKEFSKDEILDILSAGIYECWVRHFRNKNEHFSRRFKLPEIPAEVDVIDIGYFLKNNFNKKEILKTIRRVLAENYVYIDGVSGEMKVRSSLEQTFQNLVDQILRMYAVDLSSAYKKSDAARNKLKEELSDDTMNTGSKSKADIQFLVERKDRTAEEKEHAEEKFRQFIDCADQLSVSVWKGEPYSVYRLLAPSFSL